MKTPLLIYIIWRSFLFIIAGLSALFLIPKTDFTGEKFSSFGDLTFWQWANFDGEHYLWIAEYGYRQFEYAFFPTFPAVIKLFNLVLNNILISGLLVSTISSIILIFLIYKLFLLSYKPQVVIKGLVLFLAFPSSFYLVSVYNESLFLTLIVGSFLFAYHKNYFISGLLGLVAVSTRLVGLCIIPALLLIWLQGERRLRDLIGIFLPTLGIFIVMLFNWLYTQDLLNFIHVQPQFGAGRSGGEIILFPQVVYRYLKILFDINIFSHTAYIVIQELVLTVVSLVIVLIYSKKIKAEYFIFCLGVIILPTLSGTFSSMPRYLLAAFPLFFLLGDVIKSPLFYWIIVTIMIVLQIINIALFVNGYWVS